MHYNRNAGEIQVAVSDHSEYHKTVGQMPVRTRERPGGCCQKGGKKLEDGIVMIRQGGRGEYTEKRSRFIGAAAYAENEEEAAAFLAAMRKEFYDAKHHCSAFIVRQGNGTLLKRSSDDGEPQGTAGHPMLAVMEGEHLVNAVCVVTRYFGGTLLGTGGLVRSYTKAVQEALLASSLAEIRRGVPVGIRTDYASYGKLEYYIASNRLTVMDKEYGSGVSVHILVPEESAAKTIADLTELTSGKAEIRAGSVLEYGLSDGEVIFGEDLPGHGNAGSTDTAGT